MAITVDYTPYQAIGELAYSAGQGQFRQQQYAAAERKNLAILQSKLDRQNALFMAKLEQAARQEQYQYQSAYLLQKKNIDMQLELADYARNKQKLMQVISMINESEDFSPEEKSQLTLQAMSKYAGVGQGITTTSFDGTDKTMERYLQQGTVRQNLANSLQDAVNSGELTSQEAENLARSYGLIADFKSLTEQRQREIDKASQRLTDALKTLHNRFVVDDGKVKTVINNKPANKVKPGTPEHNLYLTLQAQVDDARGKLAELQARQAGTNLQDRFNQELAQSPKLQKAVEIYGADKVFEDWKKRQGNTENLEENNGVPMVMKAYPPYYSYKLGQKITELFK